MDVKTQIGEANRSSSVPLGSHWEALALDVLIKWNRSNLRTLPG